MNEKIYHNKRLTMRKFTIQSFILTAALCLTGALHALDLQTLAATLQRHTNIQGSFIQERHLQNLPAPLQSQGDFVLVPGKLLLWQMKTPFAVVLRVREDGIAQQTDSGAWQSTAQNTHHIALFMAMLAGDLTALEQQFHIRIQGGIDDWHMELTPKDALLKQIFTRITLAGDRFVRSIALDETQGDRSRLHFQHLSADAPLPAAAQQALAP